MGISAGAAHTCALDAAGRAWCWGANQYGQVGGDISDALSPRLAVTGLTFRDLKLGALHTCGISRDSALYCWGRDASNELRGLGRERCGDVRCAREPVRLYRGQVQLAAAGFGRTCLVALDGTVRCWGRGESIFPAEPDAPPALRTGLRRIWGKVVWWSGSTQRFLERKVLIPLRDAED